MYDGGPDPYCYPGTSVLKNRLGIRDQAALDAFETMITAQRAEEPLPRGRLGDAHYRAIHRHIFQDVYAWAGRTRTVRIAKGDSLFCFPEHIDAEMRRVFGGLKDARFLRGLDAEDYARNAAHFLAGLNAVHPFRDGNGRTQLVFLTLLSARAGHPLDLDRLEPAPFLQAMIGSFHGREAALARQVLGLIGSSAPPTNPS